MPWFYKKFKDHNGNMGEHYGLLRLSADPHSVKLLTSLFTCRGLYEEDRQTKRNAPSQMTGIRLNSVFSLNLKTLLYYYLESCTTKCFDILNWSALLLNNKHPIKPHSYVMSSAKFIDCLNLLNVHLEICL